MRSIDLYAQALFNAVEKTYTLDIYYDLYWLKSLPVEVIYYYSALAYQGKDIQDIYEEIKKDLGEVVSEDVIKFMAVLVEDGFLDQLPDVEGYYLDKLVEEGIVKKATIISAERLSEDFRKELEKRLQGKFQTPIITSYIVDESVIGGIRIELDDAVIDTSYKSRLERIVSEGLYEP